MGHVEPGGAVEPAAAPIASEPAYWAVWRQLTREFSTSSFIFSGLTTPGAWTTVGNDLVSGLRANRSTRRATELTAHLADSEVEALAALAALNQRRHDWVLRILIVVYATVPLTITALLAEVLGGDLLALAQRNAAATLNLLVVTCVMIAIYLMAAWRARQIGCVIELIRIERGLARP